MKILFVSSGDSVDSWVAFQLAMRFGATEMLRIKWWSDKSWTTKLRKFRRQPAKIFSHLYLGLRMKLWDRQRDELAQKYLWSQAAENPGFNPTIIELPGENFNNTSNAELIRSLEPDLMIVCGGPILREEIFNIPRLGTLNVHFGISPFYRGNHTVLWPFFHGDFDKIGATIHRIDKGVDTGEVLARIYPEIHPGDGEFSIEMKIAQLVTSTMTELLSFIEDSSPEQQLAGVKFQKRGTAIRTKDLTLWVDLKYQLRRLLGLIRVPSLPERRELFFLQRGKSA